ncbi:hypothetical protein R1flu_024793 [Riccia fluitans]|uniref:Uncharacterized protein n=1 Tax=Riccia fluitans TaxID=41844 RepID=A0ABD1XVX3_9MARC
MQIPIRNIITLHHLRQFQSAVSTRVLTRCALEESLGNSREKAEVSLMFARKAHSALLVLQLTI